MWRNEPSAKFMAVVWLYIAAIKQEMTKPR